jgi:hypothetical protein
VALKRAMRRISSSTIERKGEMRPSQERFEQYEVRSTLKMLEVFFESYSRADARFVPRAGQPCPELGPIASRAFVYI